jgi:uncharacterized protein with PQ loop repeat
MEGILTVAVVLANVLGAVMAFPQAIRLVRTRHTEGISPVWAGISVAANTWWIVYGIGTGLWEVLPVSTMSAIAYLMIIWVLGTVDPSSLRRVALGFVAVAIVPVPVLLTLGWPAVGVVVGLLYGVQLAPAVISAYRTAIPLGIAPATWLLAWSEAFLWGVYGVGTGDIALISAGLVGVVMSTLILVRLVVVRNRMLRPLPTRVAS